MPVINNLTSSSIRKFLPSKVITGTANTIAPLSSWLYDDGMGDPWWQGAQSNPYQWILSASINTVNHSSHLSRVPFQYTGLDIMPGMWVFGNANKALRVVSVISMTDLSIQCLIEDVDRYNTFTDSTGTGNGVFNQFDSLIFFELGEDGLPVINPSPDGTDPGLVGQIEDRFKVFNPSVEEQFFQLNHGFLEGQILKMDSVTGQFAQATSSDIYIVGTVTAVGPGPNYFYLSPSTKLINDLEPGLPGSAGNIISIDSSTGDLTTGAGEPIYIQMTTAAPSFTIGSVANPTTFSGTVIKLNNALVTFTGSGAIDSTDIIATINALTPNHGVVASMGSQPNVVNGTTLATSTPVGPNYMQFTMNGVLTAIAPPSIVYGDTGQIGWWDIVRAINEQTYSHGVTATCDNFTTEITFTNASGGPINIVDISPVTTSGDNKAFTDMVGISANNPSSVANYLQFIRPDGGEIVISNTSGTFTDDVGILSAANGTLPLALVVDKTMNASGSYVVNTLADRDALTNLRTGDQVYVQSDLNGEWALYLQAATGWIKIANANSASSDAKTLQMNINFASTTPQIIGNISDGTRIVDISVSVSTAFNGTAPVLTIGTLATSNAIMDTNIVDLTTIGTYESSSSFINDGTDGTDLDVYVYFTSTGSTTGSATIIVSYL